MCKLFEHTVESGGVIRIDVLLKDPNCYFYDMFSEFRRRVDLKREQLKLKIGQESQTILAEMNKLAELN